MTYEIGVAPDAPITRPLGRRHEAADRYEIPEADRHGRVFAAAPLQARLFFTSGGLLASIDRVVTGPDGDRRRTLSVVPAFAPRFLSAASVIPLGSRARTIEVRVQHFGQGAAEAVCALEVPAGWTVLPAEQALRFGGENEEAKVRFELQPPSADTPARATLRAVVTRGGASFSEELQLIDYPHVEPRRFVREAVLPVRTLSVRLPADTRVGYVAGAGDHVGQALEQLGVNVAYLSAEDLAGDLSRFPTIVTGVRAYRARPELARLHPRLMQYVEAGGHLVVQYNKVGEVDKGPFAPFPAKVGQGRITDENAPVRVLLPKHPLLNVPNAIGPADFERWVQERGLYFLDATDPRYEDLLAATDPFPENPGEKKGMLVTAKVGAGRWTYVGLGLWRQVEAGVPGAFRILANLVGQPRSGQP